MTDKEILEKIYRPRQIMLYEYRDRFSLRDE